MEAYKLEESKEEETVLVGVESPVEAGAHQVGQFQKCKLPRFLNLENESSERLKWTELEKVQHCTDLPLQVTFPAHTEKGRTGPRLE